MQEEPILTTENNELDECKKQRDEYLNNWKRATADLINYKKDEMERLAMIGNYAKESMIFKILPIIDNFYLAEKQLPEKLKSGQEGTAQSIEWTRGFLQIQKQIEEFFKKEGIEAIEVLGQQFDPNNMEVISEISNPQYPIANVVIEELQKGYKMGSKVLRPTKVSISK